MPRVQLELSEAHPAQASYDNPLAADDRGRRGVLVMGRADQALHVVGSVPQGHAARAGIDCDRRSGSRFRHGRFVAARPLADHMNHHHQGDLLGLRASKAGALQVALQATAGVALLDRLRDLEENAAGILLRADRALHCGCRPQHPFSPSAYTWNGNAVEDRLGQQLEKLTAIAHVPVEGGRLDVQAVRQATHRKRLQAVFLDQPQRLRHQPRSAQTLFSFTIAILTPLGIR